MFIGDILVARGLVTKDDVAAALELQKTRGGRLGDCLVELGKLQPDDIELAMREAPRPPASLADTGLSLQGLLSLLLKAIRSASEGTPSSLSNTLKLPPNLIGELLDLANEQGFLQARGPAYASNLAEIRYGLSEEGERRARQAIEQNGYVGPAPVSVDDYRSQVARQRISNERVSPEMIAEALGDLVVPDDIASDLGVAANSSRPMLLYGPTGNGKTSIGQRVGALFKDVIYVPYSFEIDGQIVKVYDPAIHRRVERQTDAKEDPVSLRREDLDERWVACWRPLVVLGGELTLDMLKLGPESFGPYTLYEAPPQVKALGGVMMIDDFGRQVDSPTALLNRWIVPLEGRSEYLTLRTGKTFHLPFDELVIFCTNLEPRDLVDPAFLRRITHKIEIRPPSSDDYRRIFHMTAGRSGLAVDDDVIDAVIEEVAGAGDKPLAAFQPQFVVEHILAMGKFEGAAPEFTRDRIARAIGQLYAVS